MIKKLQEAWVMITGAVTALTLIVGSAWGVFQYDQTLADHRNLNSTEIEIVGSVVQQLRKEQDMQRWLYLHDLRKKVGLGPNQHKEYCYLGKRLFGDFTCPAYKGRQPRND